MNLVIPRRIPVQRKDPGKTIKTHIEPVNRRLLILTASLAYSVFIPVQAQVLDSLLRNKRVYHTEDIGENPVPRIDGLLEDSIWLIGQWHSGFTQQQPRGGRKGTEDTYLKVLHDRSNLYVAIICRDSEPDRIRDIFDRRDVLNGDMAGIALDSYFDRRTAFEFSLSAAGQKIDIKHLGDYLWDFNWNAVWEGATSKNDSAWIAEMRIPFSQLRYSDREEQTWGMHVWRWISRKFEEDQWQWIPVDAPAMVYLFGELRGLEGIRTSRQVEILPYALASLEKNRSDDPEKPFGFNAGGDAKIGIGSDYTLDLSVNPDFGQVEADPSVLNLSSFEVFYEEKRPFFLEGNEIFDFELDGDIPYYSRRIGNAPSFPAYYEGWEISDIPVRTTILGSVKLTGKSVKGLSVGLVSGLAAGEYAQARNDSGDVREIQVAPLSNYSTARIKREFSQGKTVVGGVATMVKRFSLDEETGSLLPGGAYSGGLDILQYWDNRNYLLEAKAIASYLEGSAESILLKQTSHNHRFQRPDAGHLEVDSTRTSLAGHGALVKFGKIGGKWNFSVQGQYRSPGLNLNDMGYIREADYFGQETEIEYRVTEPGEWFRNYTLTLYHESFWSFGGENTGNQAGFVFHSMNNKLWSFNGSLTYRFSSLDTRELRGGPALRIDGSYRVQAYTGTNSSRDLFAYLSMYHRGYPARDARQDFLTAGMTWLPLRKLRFRVSADLEWQQYYQQYVPGVSGDGPQVYVIGNIDRNTAALTFRGELFFSPEMSLQYYGSPYYSAGKYDAFRKVGVAASHDLSRRLEDLSARYDPAETRYSFLDGDASYGFPDPDFSFMQLRSNLVFRWEYKLGSTLYLVWSHDRTGREGVFRPIPDMAGDLFGLRGRNIFMLKLNYWFSI